MPADFLKCESEGGKMITKSLPDGKYIHLCKDKAGKWYKGETHKKIERYNKK